MTTSKGTRDSGWKLVKDEPAKHQPTAPPVERTTAKPGATPGQRTPTEVGNSRAHGGDK
jgi:hypothetical protein